MFLFTNRSSPITITRPDAQTLKEVAPLSALADDFNSERLGLKALLREQGQELADWARHWAWVTAQVGPPPGVPLVGAWLQGAPPL